MLTITKQDAEYLRSKGFGEYVKNTFTRHKTYFLVESEKVIGEYEKYRAQLKNRKKD